MKYCLLDELVEQTKAHYISELKNKDVMKSAVTFLQSIDNETFSLDDWKDTCEYLCKSAHDIKNIEDAKQKLLSWIGS